MGFCKMHLKSGKIAHTTTTLYGCRRDSSSTPAGKFLCLTCQQFDPMGTTPLLVSPLHHRRLMSSNNFREDPTKLMTTTCCSTVKK